MENCKERQRQMQGNESDCCGQRMKQMKITINFSFVSAMFNTISPVTSNSDIYPITYIIIYKTDITKMKNLR